MSERARGIWAEITGFFVLLALVVVAIVIISFGVFVLFGTVNLGLFPAVFGGIAAVFFDRPVTNFVRTRWFGLEKKRDW